MKPDSGVSAGLLVGRGRSWGLAVGPGPELCLIAAGNGEFPDTVGYKILGILKFIVAC